MRKRVVLAVVVALALPSFAFADGAAIYKTKCTACHGADGSGQTPVGKNLKIPSLASADVQKLTDAELTKIIIDGKGKMPPSKLSAGDAKAVLGFIRAFKK